MTDKRGAKGAVGIGPETSYGVAVAPTEWMLIKSSGLKGKETKMIPDDLINFSLTRKLILSMEKTVDGPLNFPVIPESCIGLILKSFCNAVPVSAQLGSTTAYKHTFLGSEAMAVATKCSLTIRHIWDDYSHDFTGCVANSIKLSVSPKGLFDMTAGFVGQDWAVQATPGTPVLPTQLPLTYGQVSLTKGGSPFSVISAEVNITNGAEGDGGGLGSYTINKVHRGSYVVKGTVELFFADSSIYDAFMANTEYELKMTAEGAVISGAYKYSLILTLGKVCFTENPLPDIAGKKAFTLKCAFDGFYDDATDQDFKFELINTATAYA